MRIAGRNVENGGEPYIVAEMSANHNGSLETALEIIRQAKESGADAIKIQTYKPDTITLDCDKADFVITAGLWAGRRLYDLYEEAHTPWEWHREMFGLAKDLGLSIFSSPFDKTAVDFLEDLGAPAYKIASFEVVDIPLIRHVASTGKPLIISTGMANKEEIGEALDAARDAGCRDLAILHCVSGYPAPVEDYNLLTIADMRSRFDAVVGLSDHTLDNTTAIASVSLGAAIIEKHFTLNRKSGGPDSSFSLEADELASLVRSCKAAWRAMGQINYEQKPSEKENLKFRRSLYVVEDIRAGEIITSDNVRSIRPGYGLAPKYYEVVLGMRAKKVLSKGTPLCIEDLTH